MHLACRLLLAGAAGVLPLARLVELAQVLSALLQTWGNQAMSWMAAALALLPDQVVSQADKQQLLGEWFLVRVSEWFLVKVSEWFLVRVSRSGQPGGQAAAAGRVVSGEGQQASLKVPCVLML